MILEIINVGAMEVNCYILAESQGQDAIIIDPGAQVHKIKAALEKHNLKPAMVINTHGHYDHIGCDDKFNVPVMIHKYDAPFLEDPVLNLTALFFVPYKVAAKIVSLEDNQIIEHVWISLEVLHIPGHTPGCIGLLLKSPQDNIVFTGDTLFYQGIGRADLSGGDEALLIRKIREKLFILPDDTKVYPGHGPSTSIGDERGRFPG
ncbi:MAG: MBL fold metallo-hydrolase [Candidatus Omnitrophica bacterium]|nr:MBL fold metallo-hydrolase [Candidatus Omnitrophota bacterium]